MANGLFLIHKTVLGIWQNPCQNRYLIDAANGLKLRMCDDISWLETPSCLHLQYREVKGQSNGAIFAPSRILAWFRFFEHRPGMIDFSLKKKSNSYIEFDSSKVSLHQITIFVLVERLGIFAFWKYHHVVVYTRTLLVFDIFIINLITQTAK